MTATSTGRLLWRVLVIAATGLLTATAGNAWSATQTRTSAFDYDAATGLLTKEIVEPDSPTLCLVTTYTYDSLGNKASATTRNCNGSVGSVPGALGNSEASAPTGGSLTIIQPRTTTSNYNGLDLSGSRLNPPGQFATVVTNGLGHSETRTYDTRFGTVTDLKGPNGLHTTWSYDGFGRKYLEQRADGTQTRYDFTYCTPLPSGVAGCPTNAAYFFQSTPQLTASGAQNGPSSQVYDDDLNREIETISQGWDGDGVSRYAVKTTLYDTLGRVTSETQPDTTVTTFGYNGLVTSVTNAKSQTTTTVRNALGQVIQVTDAKASSVGERTALFVP